MVNQVHNEPPHNLGLDLVRATEAPALAAGRWVGLGRPIEADTSATEQMHAALNLVDIEAAVTVGEEARVHTCDALRSGQCVGTGEGPTLDLVVDAIDGRNLVAEGHPGAIAVMAVAPRGALWRPSGTAYMEKIVVDTEVADALVPECLDAPAAWTLALVARAKDKDVEDLTVFVLNRPRHKDLISEIREAGAHAMLRDEGDVTGALLAGRPGTHVDVLMGVGGITEGITAACALRATHGAMIGRLRPQSDKEQAQVVAAGFDLDRILVTEEIVNTDQVFFAATGITDGPILRGVRYSGKRAESYSLVMRGQTRTRRIIRTEHHLTERTGAWRRHIPGRPFG